MGINDLYSSGTGSRLDPPKTIGAPLQDKEGNQIDITPNEDDIRAAGRDRQMKRQIDRQIRRVARRGGVNQALELMGKRQAIFGSAAPDSATISSFEKNREMDAAMAADKKRKALLVAGAIDPRANKAIASKVEKEAGAIATGKMQESDAPKVGVADATQESADAIASKADKPSAAPARKESELEAASRKAKESGVDQSAEDSLAYDQLTGALSEKLPSQKSRLDELRDTSRTDEVIARNKEISDRSITNFNSQYEGMTTDEIYQRKLQDHKEDAGLQRSINDEVAAVSQPFADKEQEINDRLAKQVEGAQSRGSAIQHAMSELSSKELAMQDDEIAKLKKQSDELAPIKNRDLYRGLGDKLVAAGKAVSIPDHMRAFDPGMSLADRAELVMPSPAEMQGKSEAQIKSMIRSNIKDYEDRFAQTLKSVKVSVGNVGMGGVTSEPSQEDYRKALAKLNTPMNDGVSKEKSFEKTGVENALSNVGTAINNSKKNQLLNDRQKFINSAIDNRVEVGHLIKDPEFKSQYEQSKAKSKKNKEDSQKITSSANDVIAALSDSNSLI